MYWSKFCFYCMMCFTSPRIEFNSKAGLCSYYNSEDVDKMSLVLDATNDKIDDKEVSDCMKLGPFNTILMHADNSIESHSIEFPIDSVQFDHLIVLNSVTPLGSSSKHGSGIAKAVSLAVFNNRYKSEWTWLKYIQFKHVRIDSCTFPITSAIFQRMITSEYLLTLTLVNNKGLDPWNRFNYAFAPNLRELSIHKHGLSTLSAKHPTHGLQKLEKLSLRDNGIHSLQEGFFLNMPLLKEVDLTNNQLKTFSHTFSSVPRKVVLHYNPLKEDEKTCEFLRSSPFAIYSETKRICGDKIESGSEYWDL